MLPPPFLLVCDFLLVYIILYTWKYWPNGSVSVYSKDNPKKKKEPRIHV